MSGTLQTEVELKALQSRRDKLRGELNQAVLEQKDLSAKIRDTEGRLKSVEDQIRKFSQKQESVVISEHAILRYLERVAGIDRESVRAAILPPKTEEAIKKFVSGTFPVDGQKFSVKVKNGTVVTVITPTEVEH